MVIIRPARRADLPEVVRLCAAHAAYERAAPPPVDLASRLAETLFTTDPRLWCLLAVNGDTAFGYATMSMEFSTWRCSEYAHLDCLYVDEGYRGSHIGRLLLDAVAQRAHALGATELQWQTPEWNVDAIRFYDRLGARGAPKVRYTLALTPVTAQSMLSGAATQASTPRT